MSKGQDWGQSRQHGSYKTVQGRTEQHSLPLVEHVNPGPERVMVVLEADPSAATLVIERGFLLHVVKLDAE